MYYGNNMRKISRVSGLFFLFVISISAEIKVACIGNSITSGYSNTGISYVPILKTLLGNGYNVQNFGVSGTTLMKKLDNSYWNTNMFRQALAFNADIITIKLGTNDSKNGNWNNSHDTFRKDYNALIDTLIASNSGKPLIYLIFPAPVFKNQLAASWGMRDSVIINCIKPIIGEIATERELTVVDAYTPLLPFGKYFTVDGVHPDQYGADSIAHFIYRAVTAKTHLVADRFKPISRLQTRRIYSILNGYNMPNFFAELIPGHRYELSMFSLNGALIGKMPVNGTTISKLQVRDLFGNGCGSGLLMIRQNRF